jgi:hypothetical protein
MMDMIVGGMVSHARLLATQVSAAFLVCSPLPSAPVRRPYPAIPLPDHGSPVCSP